jgi:hypothetical protein
MNTIDAMKQVKKYIKEGLYWPATRKLDEAIEREEARTVEPVGFASVPLTPSAAMNAVMEQDDWEWRDVLVAAEAITEEQYNAPPPSGERAELIERLRVGITHDTRDDIVASSCYDLAHAAEEAADALQASESAAAERDALQALSVTNILLEVAPGEDGGGLEIYAKSVADVEQVLTKLGLALEDAQEEAQTLRAKLAALDV